MCMNILYDETTIQNGILGMVSQMKGDRVFGNCPAYICIMSGGAQFFVEATKEMPSGYCAYISAKSYGDGKAPGQLIVEYLPTLPEDVDSIIILDDIVDSGQTMSTIKDMFLKRYTDVPVYTSTMVYKDHGQFGLVDYFALRSGDEKFLAGFGLDNQGFDRNLPYIYEVTE